MRSIEEIKKNPAITIMPDQSLPEGMYFCVIRLWDYKGTVIWAYNENGMEHVSVSAFSKKKLPTWDDMCKIKDIFFYPEEMAVQIHPPERQYVHGVGDLENVLHLWRPADGDFSLLNRD